MQSTADTIEAAIFCRVFANKQTALPREVAEYLVGLGFSSDDRSRMHELAEKNREGRLTEDESRELDAYVLTGDVLALLQSQARKALSSQPNRQSRHGDGTGRYL